MRKLPFGIGSYIDRFFAQYLPRLMFIGVCYQIMLILWSIWEELPFNREEKYRRQAEISKKNIEQIREKRRQILDKNNNSIISFGHIAK